MLGDLILAEPKALIQPPPRIEQTLREKLPDVSDHEYLRDPVSSM